jgi:Flp pilus assembly protein protease CpaA
MAIAFPRRAWIIVIGMLSFTLPPPAITALLLALVIGAAAYDVPYRRIPNWITAVGVLLGIGMNTFLYGWPGLQTSLTGLAVGFGIFLVTAVVGGFAAMALMAMRGRVKKTLWNVGFVLTEMRHGRAAYLSNEELDVRSSKAIGLPHAAVIAVGTLVFLGLSAHFAS